MLFFAAASVLSLAVASLVPNVDLVRIQNKHRLEAREALMLDLVYQQLAPTDLDFIAQNLAVLQAQNGTKCEKCHSRMQFARKLIDTNPGKKHLTSLMLYKACLDDDGSDDVCNFIDFFITTNGYNTQQSYEDKGPLVAFDGVTSIDFSDNDFINMLQNMNMSSNLTLNYFCHYKGGYCSLPETPDLALIIDLDSMWPAKQPEHYAEPAYSSPNRSSFNVLHISDVHNELRYQVGAEANCSSGICCRPESYNDELTLSDYNFTSVYEDAGASGNIDLSFYPDAHYESNNSFVPGAYRDIPAARGWNYVFTPASTFGNYQCDVPEVFFNNSMLLIGGLAGANFEFSLFTGDVVDHDVAHCDAITTLYAEKRSYGIMKHFLSNIPIFPTLGNHDTFPYGQLAPQQINNVTLNELAYHWNEDELTELWKSNDWLNANKTSSLKNHYAAYSTVTTRGLKVISLNSNCYYQKNLYAYIDMENQPDIFGQWQFLIDELVESEKAGQRVWILAHIPTGDGDTLPIQSNIFAAIVERFSPYTIANIFFGHTHQDQFKILYSSEGEPVNMAWILQAITPLGPANPSWRYYEVEDESFNIINSNNYYTKLNETWVEGLKEPSWEFEYSARDAYDPEGLWPSDSPLNATFWDTYLVQKLSNKTEVSAHQLYTDYRFRINPYVPDCSLGGNVTDDCYIDNYCYNAAFRVDDYVVCLAAA